jgi:hypothetical protein
MGETRHKAVNGTRRMENSDQGLPNKRAKSLNCSQLRARRLGCSSAHVGPDKRTKSLRETRIATSLQQRRRHGYLRDDSLARSKVGDKLSIRHRHILELTGSCPSTRSSQAPACRTLVYSGVAASGKVSTDHVRRLVRADEFDAAGPRSYLTDETESGAADWQLMGPGECSAVETLHEPLWRCQTGKQNSGPCQDLRGFASDVDLAHTP